MSWNRELQQGRGKPNAVWKEGTQNTQQKARVSEGALNKSEKKLGPGFKILNTRGVGHRGGVVHTFGKGYKPRRWKRGSWEIPYLEREALYDRELLTKWASGCLVRTVERGDTSEKARGGDDLEGSVTHRRKRTEVGVKREQYLQRTKERGYIPTRRG